MATGGFIRPLVYVCMYVLYILSTRDVPDAGTASRASGSRTRKVESDRPEEG
jgi:hypothetical protein